MEDQELTNKVSECTTIDELVKLLSSTKTIMGSRREFTGESMARRAIAVHKGYDMPRYVTRSYGIRRKVMELNNSPRDIIDFYCHIDE